MAGFNQQPATFQEDEEEPMDQFLAKAFGNDINDSNQKGKPMLNSLQINGLNDDRPSDFEKGVFNFNALTMLPTGGPDKNVSQKPNFESIGTFKGIRGLSNDLKGLSDIIAQPQDEQTDSNFDSKLTKHKKKKSNVKKYFDVFAAYDEEEDINEDDDEDDPISDSEIMPEIIKDDSFEGEFDDNQEDT